jgi:hypothetical protein
MLEDFITNRDCRENMAREAAHSNGRQESFEKTLFKAADA